MGIHLAQAMAEILEGWQADLPLEWRNALGPISLGFTEMDDQLTLEYWEPVFPVRRGKYFPGMPDGSHMMRAFDKINPTEVRCVILGQDPYPEPGFSTGRAFEAGNITDWHDLDKMFSKSVRAYMQQIYAARTGDRSYDQSFEDWAAVRTNITSPAIDFEAPNNIADRWVNAGVLLLNTALTLSRFQVSIDPHQARGHLPLWRPLMVKTLQTLAARSTPLAIIAFGDSAAETLGFAELHGSGNNLKIEKRVHPAFADRLFAKPNPFIAVNQFFEERGLPPIAW